jgi:hypothetical protein
MWKRQIIVSRFQYRLMAGTFLYLVSIVLVFFLVVFGPVVATLGRGSITEQAVAADQLLALFERVWYIIPLLVALCLFHSVLVSHRVAGPLVRFKRLFSDVARGDLSMNIRVRRHDYLCDEAESMGEMVRAMRERVQAIQEAHRRASATLPQLMAAVGQTGGADAAVLAGRLGTEMDVLGAQLREFRMPSAGSIPAAAPARAPQAPVRTLTSARS